MLFRSLEGRSFKVDEMFDLKGTPVESGKNGEVVIISAVEGVRVNDLVRRPIDGTKTI